MTLLRITRFAVDPGQEGEMLARRSVMIDELRRRYSGPVETRLARVDDEHWLDVWRWDSPEQAADAMAGAPGIPEVAARFALVRDVSAEQAELVDER